MKFDGIRQIKSEEWTPAIDFVWETFLVCDRDRLSKEGEKSFRGFITDERLHKLFLSGYFKLYVLEEDGEVLGVIATKEYDHISLLFVDRKKQKMGIGRRLTEYVEFIAAQNGVTKTTVNAVIGAEGFYKKLGYINAGHLSEQDGVRSTPMCKFI